MGHHVMPRPDPLLSDVGLVTTLGLREPIMLGLRAPATPPSCASRSRKSDHSSASDSLLDPPSGMKSEDSDGVLGVRRNGESGILSVAFDAPGRASPACSLCSV